MRVHDDELFEHLFAENYSLEDPYTLLHHLSAEAPLHWAVQLGAVEYFRRLLSRGADVHGSYHLDNGANEPPLTTSAWQGHFQITLELIQAGAEIHAGLECHSTALEYAASMGRLDIVCLFINHSGDLQKLRRDCELSARAAQLYGHSEIANMLSSHARKMAEELGVWQEDETDACGFRESSEEDVDETDDSMSL